MTTSQVTWSLSSKVDQSHKKKDNILGDTEKLTKT